MVQHDYQTGDFAPALFGRDARISAVEHRRSSSGRVVRATAYAGPAVAEVVAGQPDWSLSWVGESAFDCVHIMVMLK